MKAVRKKPTSDAPAPSFNFGAAAAPAPTFNFGATTTPAVNAFSALLDPTEWICESCEVRNKKDAAVCKACEVPKKGAEAHAAKPAGFNAFTALLDPTEWVCKTCEVRNAKSNSKCKACEVPKEDGAAAAPVAASSTPTFSFGVSSSTKPAFNFGSNTATAAPFTFGSQTTGWNFGGFGAKKDGEDKKDGPAPTFTFGSVLSGAPATFGSIDSGKGFTGEGKLEASAASFGNTTADPTKEEFKDRKQDPSGEEGDTRIYSLAGTKVFSLKTTFENPEGETDEAKGKKTTKWVECGTGELHINTYTLQGVKKARIILRAEKTHRLVVNAPIYKEMMDSAKLEGEKFCRVSSTDLEGKPCSYLFKVKHKTDVSAIIAKIGEAVASL